MYVRHHNSLTWSLHCSCGDGWLQVDLIYSGGVTVPVHQQLKGTPDQLQVSFTHPASFASHMLTSRIAVDVGTASLGVYVEHSLERLVSFLACILCLFQSP